MWSTLLYSTLLYSTLLYSTLLYSTRLDSTSSVWSTLLYSTLLYSTLLYSTRLDSTRLDSTRLDSTLLYSTLLYSTLLYSTRYSPVFMSVSALPCPAQPFLSTLTTINWVYSSCVHRDTAGAEVCYARLRVSVHLTAHIYPSVLLSLLYREKWGRNKDPSKALCFIYHSSIHSFYLFIFWLSFNTWITF